MDSTRQRFRLGIFVIVAAALLGFMAVFFGGTPRLFQSRHRYTIIFDDAPGVIKGTPVRRSGVRIGEVEAVQLDDENGLVRVIIAIDKRYTVRSNEEPVIVPDLLSRDTTIDFVPLPPPRPEKKPLTKSEPILPAQFVQAKQEPPLAEPPSLGKPIPPGSEIRGRVPPDLRSVLREATDIIPSANQSLNQISKSVARFEKIAPVLEETLQEYAQLGRSLREMVPEIRRTNDELRADLKKVRELEPDVRRLMGEVENLARQYQRVGERVDVFLQTNADNLDSISKNAKDLTRRLADILNEENQKNLAASLKSMQGLSKSLEALADQARTQTLPRFQDTMVKFDSVLQNFNQLVLPFANRSDQMSRNLDSAIESAARFVGGFADVIATNGRQDGSIQRLFTDPTLFNNLNDASLMLVRILPRVDRILRDVEVFADKIARHPESLGVGGAIRPNSGLKDPPCAIPERGLKPHP